MPTAANEFDFQIQELYTLTPNSGVVRLGVVNSDTPSRVVSSDPVQLKPWTLDDGIRLVRLLQPETRVYGYHLVIGGGVVNKGESNKDLDLYFLPLEDDKAFPKADSDGLVGWLSKLWGEPQPLSGAGYPEVKPGSVYKRKVKFLRRDGDRIDVFIM